MKKMWPVLLALASFAAYADEAVIDPKKLRWYRGNTHTHTHTINNDGNAAPDTVVRWYREHGYQFVFLTEHEFVADVAPLNGVLGAAGKFLVLRGQEVTQVLADPEHPDGWRHAHVNGLGLNRIVMPISSGEGKVLAAGGSAMPAVLVASNTTMSEAYTRNFAAIRAAGGIPQVNHPNFRWSVKPQDLATQSGPFLVEIANGFPSANNLGGVDDQGESALSTEGFWDALLSQGKTVWAVGSDDSHDYLHLDDPLSERPGKAWIVVRAPDLTSEAILDAILRGEFYASNGVTLDTYAADRTSVTMTFKRPRDPRGVDDRRFTTRFIGEGGRLLAEVGGTKASYTFRGNEGYVRASITDSNGSRAWTQPVFLSPRR